MRLPICDMCDEEISGPVVKKGLLSLCRPCAKGQPHAAPKAPIAPVQLLPHPALKTVTRRPMEATITRLVFNCGSAGCIVMGCPKPARARRLCSAHWVAARKTGQLTETRKVIWKAAPENIDASKPGCAAIGCKHAREWRGFCRSHYNNIRRNKLQHLLLAPAKTKKSYLRTRPPRYKTPMPMIREIVRHRKEGNTWHQSALLAGAEQPTLAANRAKNLLLRGKIN
jgi:hypothetical protein